MDYIPHIIEADYIKDYIIKVKFDDGSMRLIDLVVYTERKGVFSKLKDKGYFKRFFVDLNTICWPNGADIAPERLYELGNSIEENDEVKATPV